MLIGARMVGQDLPERIVAKALVIVEVFVPSGDAKDALGQQCGLGMDGECGVTRIGNDLVEGGNETEIVVGFPKKERAGIGGDVAAGKVGVNFATAGTGKREGGCGTLCHRDGSGVGGECFMLTHSSTKPCAVALPQPLNSV